MPSPFALYPYQPGDRVTMKKPHPCGGFIWSVVRAGADVSVRCETCGHQVTLDRQSLEKRTKKVDPAGETDKPAPKPAGIGTQPGSSAKAASAAARPGSGSAKPGSGTAKPGSGSARSGSSVKAASAAAKHSGGSAAKPIARFVGKSGEGGGLAGSKTIAEKPTGREQT